MNQTTARRSPSNRSGRSPLAAVPRAGHAFATPGHVTGLFLEYNAISHSESDGNSAAGTMSYQRELEAALEAADAAAQAVLEHYARFEVIPDAPASITTDADRQAQEIILAKLRRAFPGDALSAEESTATLADAPHSGPRLWVVDPIDG